MTPNLTTFLISLTILCSCQESQKSFDTESQKKGFGIELSSTQVEDSLVSFTRMLFMPISKVSAIETEDNSSLEWLLQNGTTEDFENLLYNHPNVGLKAIGIKGLIRKSDKQLFKHLKFAMDQDMNVQYSMYCQKLGGYFLYQLDFNNSDKSDSYFSKEETIDINKILDTRKFGCT